MAAKRELIDTGTDKRYVRRNKKNQFKESDDVGRSLPQEGEKRRRWSRRDTAIRVIKSGSEIGLRVTLRDEAITVMLPGTWFTVTYRKVPDLPDLVATNVVDDRRVAVKKADFLVRASRIANNKARELGWIV